MSEAERLLLPKPGEPTEEIRLVLPKCVAEGLRINADLCETTLDDMMTQSMIGFLDSELDELLEEAAKGNLLATRALERMGADETLKRVPRRAAQRRYEEAEGFRALLDSLDGEA